MYATIAGVILAVFAFVTGGSAPVDAVDNERVIVSICGSAGVVPETVNKPSCP